MRIETSLDVRFAPESVRKPNQKPETGERTSNLPMPPLPPSRLRPRTYLKFCSKSENMGICFSSARIWLSSFTSYFVRKSVSTTAEISSRGLPIPRMNFGVAIVTGRERGRGRGRGEERKSFGES